MITLGLKPFGHDSCASIVKDGKIIVASTEERFNREKHSSKFPFKSIKFCLDFAGIKDINQIDEISIAFDYWRLIKYIHLYGFIKYFPHHTKTSLVSGFYQIKKIINIKYNIRTKLRYKGNIKFLDHHDNHAFAVFSASNYQNATVITIDGRGEQACTRIYKASSNEMKKLFQIDYPNSLGVFYTCVTEYLGFKRDEDEGKVMGLAPYGTNDLVNKMRKVIDTTKELYKLDMSYFEIQNNPNKNISNKFIKLFGPARKKGEPLTKRHKDMAKATQILLEEAVINIVKYSMKINPESNLCLTGGVALNSVTNGKILKSGIYDNIYIYPAAGDDGACVGSAIYSQFLKRRIIEQHEENKTPYLGYESNEDEIKQSINKYNLRFIKSKNVAKDVAKLISNGKFVGWYQGRAEFGPRALGNRSIVVDPRYAKNKDLVNSKIKFREAFRPFAPSVTEESASKFFDTNNINSPYMILAFDVYKDKQKIIPAVTHVDGTARIQTVNRKQNLKYWNLLKEFEKITKVPVLLNTSFNRMGEPIVNTPSEAIECFLGCGLDAIALGDYLIIK